MKPLLALSLLMFVVTGCGTTGVVKGRYVDADGRGIANAKVTFLYTGHVVPIPAKVAETVTDADGRFEVVLKESANSLSMRGGGGEGSARIGWFSQNLLVKMAPFPPHDYSTLNLDCPHLPDTAVSVSVRGQVSNPGLFTLSATDSAW